MWPVILASVTLPLISGSVAGTLTGVLVAAVLFGILALWWFSDRVVGWLAGANQVDDTDLLELRSIVRTLSNRAESPRPQLYLMEASQPFACSAGRSLHRSAIVVSTGLLSQLRRDEIESVVAHELGHIRQRNILRGLAVAVLVSESALPVVPNRSASGRFLRSLLMLALRPAARVILWMPAIREREFRADAIAIRLIATPDSLVRALQKISQAPFSLPWSFPLLTERMERLRRPA